MCCRLQVPWKRSWVGRVATVFPTSSAGTSTHRPSARATWWRGTATRRGTRPSTASWRYRACSCLRARWGTYLSYLSVNWNTCNGPLRTVSLWNGTLSIEYPIMAMIIWWQCDIIKGCWMFRNRLTYIMFILDTDKIKYKYYSLHLKLSQICS